MESEVKTPELEKIQTNRQESQSIGSFLDWLQNEQEVLLCRCGRIDELYPIDEGIEKLLAEYFGIDLNKAELERQALLDEIRKNNS